MLKTKSNRKGVMAEHTEKFQDDKGRVNVVGGTGQQQKDVKIVGGGSRPAEIKVMDKHPEKKS